MNHGGDINTKVADAPASFTTPPQLPLDDSSENRATLEEAIALLYRLDDAIRSRIADHPGHWLREIRACVQLAANTTAERWRAPQIAALIDAELARRSDAAGGVQDDDNR
jgi:hypothetical protein